MFNKFRLEILLCILTVTVFVLSACSLDNMITINNQEVWQEIDKNIFSIKEDKWYALTFTINNKTYTKSNMEDLFTDFKYYYPATINEEGYNQIWCAYDLKTAVDTNGNVLLTFDKDTNDLARIDILTDITNFDAYAINNNTTINNLVNNFTQDVVYLDDKYWFALDNSFVCIESKDSATISKISFFEGRCALLDNTVTIDNKLMGSDEVVAKILEAGNAADSVLADFNLMPKDEYYKYSLSGFDYMGIHIGSKYDEVHTILGDSPLDYLNMNIGSDSLEWYALNIQIDSKYVVTPLYMQDVAQIDNTDILKKVFTKKHMEDVLVQFRYNENKELIAVYLPLKNY